MRLFWTKDGENWTGQEASMLSNRKDVCESSVLGCFWSWIFYHLFPAEQKGIWGFFTERGEMKKRCWGWPQNHPLRSLLTHQQVGEGCEEGCCKYKSSFKCRRGRRHLSLGEGKKREDKELNWGNLSSNDLQSTPQPAESLLLKPARNLSKLFVRTQQAARKE